MVPIWWQSNEIESSYRVYKAIVGHFSNVLAAILDMDHGKILIIELVRDIPESNLWYQFGGNPMR